MYDLIILGGGPAGYRAAERAGASGLRTLLIEKRALGGVCLNEGCIPSKALLNSAKIYDYAKGHGSDYGVTCSGASLDQAFVIRRKNKVVKKLVAGIAAAMKKYGVEVVSAEGKILGRTAEGFEAEAGGQKYTAKRLLIATGSEAVVPPIPGVREGLASGYVLTNREVLDLQQIPKSLVVIGGGVIGLEMASYYNSAGAKVTVVEMLDKIAGPTDGDISALLLKSYESSGVTFHLGARVTSVGEGFVTFEKGGKTETVEAEKVLLSIGRRAVTAGIGLESVGVVTERGAVVTDEQMKTSIPGIFAAGDVNGKSMLAHTAYREAEVAVNTILGKKDRMSYRAIPAVIYTNPEVASVGDTQESAKARGLDVHEIKIPLQYSGRYVAENEGGTGIAKMIVEKGSRRLVGVHMIGNPCSEIIVAAALMLEKELRTGDLESLVFPHPSVGEALREGIFE